MEVVGQIGLWVWLVAVTTYVAVQGSVVTDLRRTIQRRPWISDRPVVERKPDRERFTCGCGHHFAFHNRDTGLCHHRVAVDETCRTPGGAVKNYVNRQRTCRCQGYTGVLPLQFDARSDDEVVRLADGTTLTFPSALTGEPGSEVVRWTPSS